MDPIEELDSVAVLDCPEDVDLATVEASRMAEPDSPEPSAPTTTPTPKAPPPDPVREPYVEPSPQRRECPQPGEGDDLPACRRLDGGEEIDLTDFTI